MNALWEQELFQALSGDTLRPGGSAATREALEWLSSQALLRPGCLAVDFGCGPGATVRLLAQYGCRAVGLDLRHDRFPEGFPGICGDLAHLPLRSSSIALGICECVLSVLADPLDALEAVADALEPEGCCLISDLTRDVKVGPCRDAQTCVSCLSGAKTLSEWQELFQAAGFRVLHAKDHSSSLRQLAAQLLWYGGKHLFGGTCRDPVREKFGYWLWILRKEGKKGTPGGRGITRNDADEK